MTVERIRKVMAAQPFEPFTINLSDGRSFRIGHPDFIAVPPRRGATIMFFTVDGDFELITLRQITGISGRGKAPTEEAAPAKADDDPGFE